MNKKKRMISTIKTNSIKLLINHQLPKQLVVYINKLDDDSSLKEIEFLKTLSEHYMRLKGYYKKYPVVHDEYNKEIRKVYENSQF